MFKSIKKDPGRELMPIDEVVGNLPFIVRRDHRIVAAFARSSPRSIGPSCGRSMTSRSSPCIRPKRSLTSFRTGKR